MQLFRAEISKVFTPRSHEVNEGMYSPRAVLEQALKDRIVGSMHCLLFGESGNGKSWLYKKAFADMDVSYVVVNCASVQGIGSVTGALLSAVVPPGTAVNVSYKEGKEGGVNVMVADAAVNHEKEFRIQQAEPMLQAFALLSKKAKGKLTVIVWDNLESIFSNPRYMEEMANAVILLDDPRYAIHKVRFLIVGTPAGVLQYFEKSPHAASVSNRLIELPKVGSMTEDETGKIVERGFQYYLKAELKPEQLKEIRKHVFHVTLGVAQRIHEYCETLALLMSRRGWKYVPELLEEADKEWMRIGLRDSYVAIQANLNARKTSVARRDQVIYAVGKCTAHQFDVARIEDLLKQHFPATIPESGAMGVGAILAELSNGDKPLLTRVAKSATYSVLDPRYIMAIRAALVLDKQGKVVLKGFTVT